MTSLSLISQGLYFLHEFNVPVISQLNCFAEHLYFVRECITEPLPGNIQYDCVYRASVAHSEYICNCKEPLCNGASR